MLNHIRNNHLHNTNDGGQAMGGVKSWGMYR